MKWIAVSLPLIITGRGDLGRGFWLALVKLFELFLNGPKEFHIRLLLDGLGVFQIIAD